MSTAAIDRVVSEIESAADEAVAFTRDLIRIPTVNPPGEAYEDCARLIGDRLARCQFDVGPSLPTAGPNIPRVIPASTSSAPGWGARRVPWCI